MCAEVIIGQLCLSCRVVFLDDVGQEVLDVPFREALVPTGFLDWRVEAPLADREASSAYAAVGSALRWRCQRDPRWR